ncbi:hypothetical protein DENSPDRAFT_885046 [Dentipellis sp. KUC8613]|nr:hypothetical protein DENSPDRAFT_885046 [Dentipellis sp. KUC8613]
MSQLPCKRDFVSFTSSPAPFPALRPSLSSRSSLRGSHGCIKVNIFRSVRPSTRSPVHSLACPPARPPARTTHRYRAVEGIGRTTTGTSHLQRTQRVAACTKADDAAPSATPVPNQRTLCWRHPLLVVTPAACPLLTLLVASTPSHSRTSPLHAVRRLSTPSAASPHLMLWSSRATAALAALSPPHATSTRTHVAVTRAPVALFRGRDPPLPSCTPSPPPCTPASPPYAPTQPSHAEMAPHLRQPHLSP